MTAPTKGEAGVCDAGMRPARMNLKSVPCCGCGQPSVHESGWCGRPLAKGFVPPSPAATLDVEAVEGLIKEARARLEGNQQCNVCDRKWERHTLAEKLRCSEYRNRMGARAGDMLLAEVKRLREAIAGPMIDRIRDLEAQLAAAKANVTASQRSDVHYRRNAEVAFAQRKEELAASESAHAETRRELDFARTSLDVAKRDVKIMHDVVNRCGKERCEERVETDCLRKSFEDRETETWRLVAALIEGIANAPGRLPSYIQEPRDALLAARAEREKR